MTKQIYRKLTIFFITIISCIIFFPSIGTPQIQKTKSANLFVNSIGVAVHLSFTDTAYGNYNEIIKPRLKELGIKHIRGDGPTLKDKNTQNKFNDLANIGIKSTIIMEPRRVNPKEAVEVAKNLSSSLEAIEGPNEWDLQPQYNYEGQNFPVGLRKYQTELYSAIKLDPVTSHLKVLAPSIAHMKNIDLLGKVPCDAGNLHFYPGPQTPTARNKYERKLDTRFISQVKNMCGTNEFITTETGYHNALKDQKTRSQGLPETVAAKYLLRLFFEFFNRGIEHTYSYELIDYKSNSALDNYQYHFGLLRNDGSPKPDFIGIRNTIALLEDDSTSNSISHKLSQLNYKLKGDTNNIHHTVLQKNNGNYYLIFWQDFKSYNYDDKEEIPVRRQTIKILLNKAIKEGNLYNPLRSIKSALKFTNTKSIYINVRDYPIILELIHS
ncbi:MAG: hypothetical protein AAF298_06750 [Cyanobacteria bacterium P01_A01_bin.40]